MGDSGKSQGITRFSWDDLERRLDQLAQHCKEFRLVVLFGKAAAACRYDLIIVALGREERYQVDTGAGAVLDIVKSLFTPDNIWHPPVSNLIVLADREAHRVQVRLALSLKDGCVVAAALVMEELP